MKAYLIQRSWPNGVTTIELVGTKVEARYHTQAASKRGAIAAWTSRDIPETKAEILEYINVLLRSQLAVCSDGRRLNMRENH